MEAKEESFGPLGKPVPFKTTDAILAFCLYKALGRNAEHEPPVNIFTPEILQRLGYKGELLEVARKAWKRGDRGSVEYCFSKEPDPGLVKYFIEAYHDQAARLKTAEGDVGEHVREIMHLAADGDENGKKMDEREALLRILCTALKFRPAFMDRWKQRPSRLRTYDPKEAVTVQTRSGSRTRQEINFREIPLNMSDEQLKEAGLL